MILDLIINMFYLVLNPVISLLPDVSALPTGMTDAFLWFYDQFNSVNYIFPFVSTLFEIVLLIISLELIIQSFLIFTWVYQRVRG